MLSLPQTAIYALRAVHRIAEEPGGDWVRASDVAESLELPANYLSKTLHQLVRAEVLQSTRGPHGGFRLVRPPARTTLAEVVRPFLPLEGRACILGRGTCNDRSPCPAHHRWRSVKSGMHDFFGDTTIDTFVQSEIPAVRR